MMPTVVHELRAEQSTTNAIDVVTGQMRFDVTLLNTAVSGQLNLWCVRAYLKGLSWVSDVFGGGSTGMTGTFSGRYQRIANKMSGEIKIILTAKGSSTGSAVVGGLPIAANANSFQNGAFSPIAFNMASLTSSITGRLTASSTSISISHWGAAGSSDLAETNFTNTSNLYLQFAYEI